MSAFFLMWQSLLWTRMTHDTAGDICLHFYCSFAALCHACGFSGRRSQGVEACGFPPDATNKLELKDAGLDKALKRMLVISDMSQHHSTEILCSVAKAYFERELVQLGLPGDGIEYISIGWV